MLQKVVKVMLQDCLKHSGPTPASRVQHLAYLLSHHDQNKMEARPAQTVILSVLALTLKECFSQCSTKLEQHQHSTNSDWIPENLKDPHSSWRHLAGLLNNSPVSVILSPLRTLSHHASLILCFFMDLIDILNLDYNHSMTHLAEDWGVGLRSLVKGSWIDMLSGSVWHTCLAGAAVSLMVTEVIGIVTNGCDKQEGGVSSSTNIILKWKCEEVLSPLLTFLEHEFPMSLHQCYSQYEEEEIEWTERDEEVGHMLKVRENMSFFLHWVVILLLLIKPECPLPCGLHLSLGDSC